MSFLSLLLIFYLWFPSDLLSSFYVSFYLYLSCLKFVAFLEVLTWCLSLFLKTQQWFFQMLLLSSFSFWTLIKCVLNLSTSFLTGSLRNFYIPSFVFLLLSMDIFFWYIFQFYDYLQYMWLLSLTIQYLSFSYCFSVWEYPFYSQCSFYTWNCHFYIWNHPFYPIISWQN